MDVNLPADLAAKLQQHLTTGRFPDANALIEQAVRRFLDEEQRSDDRLEALRRVAQAVDDAGLYERILVPESQ